MPSQDFIALPEKSSFISVESFFCHEPNLTAKREEIDAELSGTLGVTPRVRKTQRCSTCHEEGHTARTCPQKPAE